jgi:hypothetical protein
VWDAIIPDGVRWTASNHFATFLIACSAPLFPEETTEAAVSAFIER